MQSSVPGYSFSNRKYDSYTAPDHGEAPNLSFAVDSYSMEAGRSREAAIRSCEKKLQFKLLELFRAPGFLMLNPGLL